jgi:hypothetical protein
MLMEARRGAGGSAKAKKDETYLGGALLPAPLKSGD